MIANEWKKSYIASQCNGCTYTQENKEKWGISNFSKTDPCMTCIRLNKAMVGNEKFFDNFTIDNKIEMRKIWNS